MIIQCDIYIYNMLYLVLALMYYSTIIRIKQKNKCQNNPAFDSLLSYELQINQCSFEKSSSIPLAVRVRGYVLGRILRSKLRMFIPAFAAEPTKACTATAC